MGPKACCQKGQPRGAHGDRCAEVYSCTLTILDERDDILCETLSEPFDRAQGERVSTRDHNPEPFVLSRVEAHFESFYAV